MDMVLKNTTKKEGSKNKEEKKDVSSCFHERHPTERGREQGTKIMYPIGEPT